MADGREQREENKLRTEQEKQEDRENQIVPSEIDAWEPERVDS